MAPAARRRSHPSRPVVVDDFPVLTGGPTLRTSTDASDLTIGGELEWARRWTGAEFRQLPREQITGDIHCVMVM